MSNEATGLASEGPVSFAEFAEETGGAWPDGWYKAKVIAGYSTRGGKQFRTEDLISQKGDSRNLWICLEARHGSETRNYRTMLNYRVEDGNPDRMELVRQARKENAGVKGKWVGQEDLQRTSLAITKLGNAEKTFGMFQRHPQNHTFLAGPLIGRECDIRLVMDGEYQEVKSFAPPGSRVR